MNNKKDCIFYDKAKNKCKALKCLYCEIDVNPCRFFKPKAIARAEEKQVTSK